MHPNLNRMMFRKKYLVFLRNNINNRQVMAKIK